MIEEIKSCLKRYADDMSRHSCHRERQTEELLSRLGQIGIRRGLEVAYTDVKAGRSEWLYDLTFLCREKTPQHFLQRVEMALESEWNDGYDALMADFDKLLQARATVKVMVCRRQTFDVSAVFLRAVAKCPGLEKCTYLFAICDFENATHPVSFVECDERGVRKNAVATAEALRRYLGIVGKETSDVHYNLAFEGFWPNKKSGFIYDRPGLYFVFVGRRKESATGYVAELQRLIYIGTPQETGALAAAGGGGPNVFELSCRQLGEIPYYAFAAFSGDLETCRMGLLTKFEPEINMFRELIRKPPQRITVNMTGDVADCLGDKTFVI